MGCLKATDKDMCARKGCAWKVTDDPTDCEMTTTTSTPRTTEVGCCVASGSFSLRVSELCNAKIGRESCERSGKCEFREGEDDCSLPTTTSTSTPSTTSEEVGCCKGEDAKSNEMCNQKTDRKSCDRSSSCTFIVDGTNDVECRFDEEEEPGCCYGDTAKTNEMCAAKEDKEMCERQATKCVWKPDESDDEPADCSLPTTTLPPLGCCRGDSYSSCGGGGSYGGYGENGRGWTENAYRDSVD